MAQVIEWLWVILAILLLVVIDCAQELHDSYIRWRWSKWSNAKRCAYLLQHAVEDDPVLTKYGDYDRPE